MRTENRNRLLVGGAGGALSVLPSRFPGQGCPRHTVYTIFLMTCVTCVMGLV